jgi:hypothetical protein
MAAIDVLEGARLIRSVPPKGPDGRGLFPFGGSRSFSPRSRKTLQARKTACPRLEHDPSLRFDFHFRRSGTLRPREVVIALRIMRGSVSVSCGSRPSSTTQKYIVSIQSTHSGGIAKVSSIILPDSPVQRLRQPGAATLHATTGAGRSRYATYQALTRLEELKLIQCHQEARSHFSFWELNKRGFQTIREPLGELKEEGFLSENVWHDLNVVAFHLGE